MRVLPLAPVIIPWLALLQASFTAQSTSMTPQSRAAAALPPLRMGFRLARCTHYLIQSDVSPMVLASPPIARTSSSAFAEDDT